MGLGQPIPQKGLAEIQFRCRALHQAQDGQAGSQRGEATGKGAMSKGDLEPGESHPAAYDALEYLQEINISELMIWVEVFASTAIEGNRLGVICSETLRRLMEDEPVSDRYILGLAWTIKYAKQADA